MKRRNILILSLGLGLALLAWQTPALLRLIPSRYLAAYAPEEVQALAIRDQETFLPTADAPVDVGDLLAPLDPTLPAPSPTPLPVPTTAVETVTGTSTPIPQPTTPPTATPVPAPTLPPPPAAARLQGIAHQFQTWNNCGPATLAMAISHFGLYLNQSDTAAFLKPNPEDRNVSPWEMAAYVNERTEFAALYRTNGDLDRLRRMLAADMPVIVEVGIDPPGEYAWMEWYGHYLLAVAYDDTTEEAWMYDSWFGTSEAPGANADLQGRPMSYTDLEHYWEQFNFNYVVLYRPDQAEQLAAIVGEEMDDEIMWNNSLRRMQAILNREPDNAYAWFNLGTIHNALDNFDRSATAFDRAREIGLPWRMLWYQFGPFEAYYETGRYDDVIALADLTLRDRPYFEESFYYRGLAQAARGELAAAERDLQRSADFNPNFAPAAAALANLGTGG